MKSYPRIFLLLSGLVLVFTAQALPQSKIETPRDGQKDFDFEIGTWKTKLKTSTKALVRFDHVGRIRGDDGRPQGLGRAR